MDLDWVCEKMLSNRLLTGKKIGRALDLDDAGNILQVAASRLSRV